MPSLKEWLFGSNEKTKQLPTMNQGQQNIFGILEQLLGGGGGQMGQGGQGISSAFNLLQGYLNPESDVYKNFEAPYMNQFNEQILPGIAERFAGGGANSGALSSSGFGQALGGAGAGLQANLAGMKGQMQQNSIQNILGLLQNYLNKDTFAYQQTPASSGLIAPLIGKFAEGAGKGAFGGF